jgi:hypothetical protein
MKRTEKKFIKIDFKNARLEMVNNELYVVEFDKDGCAVEETKLMDAIEDLLGQDGISITIKKENDLIEE